MIDVDAISNDTGRADRSKKHGLRRYKKKATRINGNSNAEKTLKRRNQKKIVNISNKDLSDDEKMVYNNFIAKIPHLRWMN